jgi:signal transduction histidine kinase
MRLSIEAIARIGFGIALIAIVVMSMTSFQASADAVTTKETIVRANAIIMRLDILLSTLQVVDRKQHDSTSAADHLSRTAYHQVVQTVAHELSTLRALVADDAVQKERLLRIEALTTAYFADHTAPGNAQLSSATTPTWRNSPPPYHSHIELATNQVIEMKRYEQQLARVYDIKKQTTAQINSLVIATGCVITAMSLIIMNRALRQHTNTQRQAEVALQHARYNLEDQIRAHIAELAQSNHSLLSEVIKRRKAENEVRRLNAHLEHLIAERTAQLEQANKELEAFSYSVSHDLRAPLRHIAGYNRALQEDYESRLDPIGVQYLQRIQAATHRMDQLIDALLQLSRLSRADVQRSTTDLSALVQSICVDLQERYPDRQVKVAITPGVYAMADAQLLRIALENVLANAWKFTQKQEHPRIVFGSLRRAGETIFFVRDNGAGFDMALAHTLFQPFQRLHVSSEFEGNGIGLAIVQRIIVRHRGRVWAKGAVNKGATFFFTLDTRPISRQGRSPYTNPPSAGVIDAA